MGFNIRILIICHQYSHGGLSRVILELKQALSSLGHSVDIMAPYYSSQKGLDLPVDSLKLPGILGYFSFWDNAAKRALRIANDYDLLLLHHPAFPSTRVLKTNKDIVITFHGTYHGYAQAYKQYNLGFIWPYYWLATQSERYLLIQLSSYKGSNLTVTGVSPATLSELRANGYSGDSKFIPNGIPTIHAKAEKEMAREQLNSYYKFNFTKKDKLLLYIGSSINVASKRAHLIPSFFKALAKQYGENLNLILIGGFNSVLIKELSITSNIYNLGYIPHEQLPLFYSSADAYISLSCYEGLPNSVLEASAYGLPLVLSDIPAHRSIYSENIGQGILVDALNPLNDVSKTSSFLSSTERHYSEKIKKFSWESIAKSYLVT